jgi:hypothetical protein
LQENLEVFTSNLNTDVEQAVAVVQVILESQTRIPSDLSDQTFFGEYDFYVFVVVEDDRTYFDCKVLDKMVMTGLELRGAFPYLQIIGSNYILAKNHVNCRCILIRVTSLADYIRMAW